MNCKIIFKSSLDEILVHHDDGSLEITKWSYVGNMFKNSMLYKAQFIREAEVLYEATIESILFNVYYETDKYMFVRSKYSDSPYIFGIVINKTSTVIIGNYTIPNMDFIDKL